MCKNLNMTTKYKEEYGPPQRASVAPCSPLLSPTKSSNSSKMGDTTEDDALSNLSQVTSPMMTPKFNFDALINLLGEFGLFQKILYFLLWLPAAALSAGVYASVFLEYVPQHRCQLPQSCTNANANHSTYEPLPYWFDQLNDTSCTMPKLTATVDNDDCIPDFDTITTCNNGYVYDPSVFSSTVISEFNAVCEQSHIKKISTVTYMTGMLFGSLFFGWFSDRFGRRFCFALTVLFLTVGSVSAAFSVNYPMYIASRFMTSMGGMGIFITSFVLSMEFVGPKYRTACGIGIELPFALGELYLIGLAYLVRDWRALQLTIGVPFTIFFLYLIKLPESVRWAISAGKIDTAKKTIKQVADFNKVVLPEDIFDNIPLRSSDEKRMSFGALLTSPNLRNRFIIMGVNWIVTTLCYYGLSMSASFVGDVFSTFAMAATMEIPSYLFCLCVVDKLGRKSILTGVQILAGVCCLVAGFLPEENYDVRLTMVMIGKFGSSAAFAVIFLYTAELFPTPLRNSAVGFCSTLARFGGIMAPIVADLGHIQVQLPFLIMGGSSLFGGVLAMYLPETMGKRLPDTLEEALCISQETVVVLDEEENKEKNVVAKEKACVA